jgi:hypothetical protein
VENRKPLCTQPTQPRKAGARNMTHYNRLIYKYDQQQDRMDIGLIPSTRTLYIGYENYHMQRSGSITNNSVMMLTYLGRYTTGLRYIYCLLDYSNSPLHYCTAKLAPTPTATVSMVPGYVWEEPSARYTRDNRWWPALVVTEGVV